MGLNYTVEISADLVTWTDAEIAIPGTGDPITSPVAAGTGRRFFRVSVDDSTDGDCGQRGRSCGCGCGC